MIDSLTVFLMLLLVFMWTFFLIARKSVNELKREHAEKLKAGQAEAESGSNP